MVERADGRDTRQSGGSADGPEYQLKYSEDGEMRATQKVDTESLD